MIPVGSTPFFGIAYPALVGASYAVVKSDGTVVTGSGFFTDTGAGNCVLQLAATETDTVGPLSIIVKKLGGGAIASLTTYVG